MATAVIGATGRVGSEIVRGVLARGEAVTALVRDAGKARRAFGEPGGLHIRPTRLDDRATLPRHLTGSARCSSRWDQSGSRASCNGS
jgi:NAD(P)H dehydrogenase (quinone)